MNRIATCILMCAALAACGDNHKEPLTIQLFAAAPDAIETGESTKLLFAVTPASADVTIDNGIGDVSGMNEVMVTPGVTTTFELTATHGNESQTMQATVTVGPRHAAGLKIEPASTTPTAGDAVAVTITAVASDGSVAPGYRGTVHLGSSDTQAVLPADVAFTAADAGVKSGVMLTLKTSGLETITGVDTISAGTAGSATVTVGAAAASTYALSTLPSAATAGESLVLAITAKDMFGNVATGYSGSAQVTSTDPTDILPAAGAFTAGVRTVSVAFTKVGSHTATVSDVATTITAVDTNSVVIGAGPPATISLSTPHSTATAGSSETVTATMIDAYGNTATNYTGTVHFTSTDGQAVLPADYTFVAGDNGTHPFDVTLKTAGPESVTATESVLSTHNSVAWDVLAAQASTCATVQTPASTTAGAPLGVTVVVKDAFNNVAKGYSGTIALTSTDVRAILPPNVTYSPLLDAGSHVFSASLLTSGAQMIFATDTADATLTCNALISVGPGAPGFVLTLAANANAGYAQSVGLAVRDAFGNPVTTYAGTVSFTSTDSGAGAATPSPITFTGSEGGVATTSATFVTIGAQTLAATDGSATGSASTACHGLVYTGPATGRVRLVANATSNTQIVQLDLIANERLEVSSFFGGGPGSFTAGMNLPLDTTRVGPDATLFTRGNALPLGTGTLAQGAAIGATDHVLYTAVARKRVAGTIFTQETEVQAGQTFYSVRLKLTPTGSVGPVFDGAQPSPLYRAAVRDQWGDDFVNAGDFGVGRLEVR